MKPKNLSLKLNTYRRKGLFGEAAHMPRLAGNYLAKSRHNLETANIIWKISEEEDIKRTIDIGEGYRAYDWVIISAYYAMYHSALSALAKLGYKSDNHEVTILALEYYFVYQKGTLEKKYVEKLKEAKELEEEYIEKIRAARRRRIAAQYDVEERFGREEARKLIDDAVEFLDRLESLVAQTEETP